MRCVAGKYQDLEGNVTCKVCPGGYYCAEGSAAPLPCPGGTTMDASLAVMMAADACLLFTPIEVLVESNTLYEDAALLLGVSWAAAGLGLSLQPSSPRCKLHWVLWAISKHMGIHI